MKTDEEIVSLYRTRKRDRDPALTRMDDVRKTYNGEIIVPLPELDKNEKASAVNLLGPGLDQFASRVASTMPDISYPPVRPGIELSEAKARRRRQANLAWWDMNGMGLVLRKRARFFFAYGSSPATISPVSASPLDKRRIPHWRIRNPLESFPAPVSDATDLEPSDCVFAFRQSMGWLVSRYPVAYQRLSGGKPVNPDTPVDLVEYNDESETVLVALGTTVTPRPDGGLWTPQPDSAPQTAPFVRLEQWPNKAGVPLTVVAGRITLDKPIGLFDQVMGQYMKASKLEALETIAIQKSVFTEYWLEPMPNSVGDPMLLKMADGMRGVVGSVKNGRIQPVTTNPSVQVPGALDRMERSQRLSANLPPEFGGESGSNIRTARRGEMVMGAAVDMPIQEAQEVIAASLEAENRRAVAVMKGWYAGKRVFFPDRSGKEPTRTGSDSDYDTDDFETDTNYVKYSMPGTDVNGLTIMIGQLIGLGVLSTETATQLLPLIEDPKRELAQVQAEGVRRALLMSIEQQATQGQLDLATAAAIVKGLLSDPDKNLEDVVTDVHEKMQADQAAQQAQPPDPSSPDAQPGLAGGAPAVAPPQPSQQNLAALLQSLRGPANQSKPELAMAAQAPSGLGQ